MQTEEAVERVEQVQEPEEPQSPGRVLREERMRKGLDEKEVADKLHITMHYVRAIESDTYEKLPGSVFARGYIKSYAELLSLDPGHLVQLYDQRVATNRDQAEAAAAGNTNRFARNRSRFILSALVCVGGIGLFWAYNEFVRSDDAGATSGPAVTAPDPNAQSAADSAYPPTRQFAVVSSVARHA